MSAGSRHAVLALAAAAVLVAAAGCAHFVVLSDPLDAAEHNDLGVAYEHSGDLKLAAKEYRRALRRKPHYATARVNLGNLSAGAGRWKSAAREYERALRDSSNADAMNNLAVALSHLGKGEAARGWAERAVATGGPRDSVYRATLAEILTATH